MRYQETNGTLLYSHRESDLAFVRAVSKEVYTRYPGGADTWRPADPDRMWGISLSPRAGVLGVTINGRTACVKLFYDERLRNRVRTRLGFSKGRRAYRNGVCLGQLGIHCPQMWGYAERRPAGPGMIVTELIGDAARLDEWISNHGASRDMVRTLARFIRDMHDKGVWHVDLSPRNILVRFRAGQLDFLLLDYEDARFAPRVGRRRRLENLHHLHERMVRSIPIRDRLRFLHAYAPPDYRAWRDALHRMLGRSRR
ncbi:MAG: hypothetical protein JW993_09500 [Sedimentisphaerales bacterium]|nr:hypothetical protein [Sedimentisphaerales bacterium]